MTNFQVYRKTLSFSFVMFLVDLVALAALVGCATAGFFIANSSTSRALIGLGIGFVVGIIISALINFFVNNRIRAAQIAMMTKGVVEDQLPDHTFKSGLEEMKGRFGKITAFFVITGLIKGAFRQLGRAVNRLGTAIGGDVGNTVTSVIDSAIQTLIAYLCDCCLGWILYRKDENSAKAGCEGAVIFFKHGKTLIRNVGRIFGMGFLSLAIFGGAFFGIFYLVFNTQPQMFTALAQEISDAAARGETTLPYFLTDPTYLMLFACGFGGVIGFFIVHSVFVRPFILVGVLRNFMAAGQAHIPTEEDFKELDAKSPKFARLHKSY